MNSMADSMARDRAVRLDITVPSSKRAREEEGGDAGGDVGPPEAQRARAGERAPGTVAAITSQAAAPAGAATLESETYKLEVSRGGKGRGD